MNGAPEPRAGSGAKALLLGMLLAAAGVAAVWLLLRSLGWGFSGAG